MSTDDWSVFEYVEYVVNQIIDLSEFLWRQPEQEIPTSGEWSREVDAGPAFVRITVSFRPTGHTREWTEAAAVAGDPAEDPWAREVARAVVDGTTADLVVGILAELDEGGERP